MKTKLIFTTLLAMFLLPAARAQTNFGNAISLNGVNQYISVTNFGNILPTNEITVEFWAKANDYGEQSAFMLQPDDPTNRFKSHISYFNGNTYWDFGDIDTSGRIWTATPPYTIGNWVHYALVASQSGNYMAIYTNGNLFVTQSGMTPFLRGVYDLCIGGSTYFYLNGSIDDFRIWNVARTPGQILGNFSHPLTGSESNLVVYYRFDESGGTVASNSATATGAAYNGTLVNGPVRVSATEPYRAFVLGSSSLVEGPVAGNDSVVLGVTPVGTTSRPWTAEANANWLHVSPGFQNGTGSTNVIFSFDDNPGSTRTGTLTIAGQTVTITQAGAAFVAANPVVTLVSSNLSIPSGIAVDGAGNVYIADYDNNAIKKWSPASQTLSTLVASNLNHPKYVAVDPAGNVYFSAPSWFGIYKWSAASNTLSVYAGGIGYVNGLAVDNAGIVYFDLENDPSVYKWTPPSGPKTTLVSGTGFYNPGGMALDRAGNLYIADTYNQWIKKWNPADHTVTNLVSTAPAEPFSVAVDGSGNVYADNIAYGGMQRWTAASNAMTLLVPADYNPLGVAVDGSGNVYFNNKDNNLLQEMPQAWVDNSAHSISALGGTAAFNLVLPTTEFLGGAFAPYAQDPWLAVMGASNGVVHLAFSAGIRSTEFNILGQSFPVIEFPPFALTNPVRLSNGQFQFSFFCNLGNHFTILATSNPALPIDQWDVIDAFYQNGSGSFQLTDPQATNNVRRFYQVRVP